MAMSGDAIGSISNGKWRLRSSWTAVHNKAANSSTITVNHYLVLGNYSTINIGGRTGNSCNCGGDYKEFSSPSIYDMTSQNWEKSHFLGTTVHTLAHDENGYRSFDITAVFYIRATLSGTYYNSITATGSFTLDRIAPLNVALYVNEEKIDGTFAGEVLWKNIEVKYGKSYSERWTKTGFEDVVFSNTNVTQDLRHSKKAYRLQYYLDLCGFLDNVNKDTLKNGVVTYGTCSLSFNDGTVQQNELTDYNKKHRYGTTYNFLNIKPSIGHTYKGVKEGSLTGQITKDTITRLNFVTNDVYANCNKDSPGDVYIKTNNEWKRASAVYYNKNGDWIKING